MADANYKLIEEKNDSMWFEGSPVILCAMKLELNTSNSKLYTSAKFMNIQPDNLRNLSLEIICYNENREPIDRIKGVVFSGLDVERHTDFGYNRRIPVENLNTRSVEYIVVSVTNVFNQQWENEGLKPFNEKIEQKNIYEVQGDYNKQFLEICTRSGIDGTILVFEPEFKKSHWLCACGGFNWNDERVCTLCGVGRSWLEKNTSIEALEKQKEFQMTEAIRIKEQIQSQVMGADDKSAMKEEFENRTKEFKKQQKKQQKKKRIRTSFIIALIIAIIGALVYFAIAFGIPYIKYTTAISNMQKENYDAAIDSFTELENFMDSNNYRIQSMYGKAMDLAEDKKYQEAADIFKKLGDYSDSKERYKKAIYDLAYKQMDELDYVSANENFRLIGDYKDSKERTEECLAGLFREANSYFENTKYETAYQKFGYLADLEYKDSKEMMQECRYIQANNDYYILRYVRALKEYNEIKGYKNVDALLEKYKMLSQIISGVTEKHDARWESGEMACPYCKKDGATYYLVFSSIGKMFFGLDCPNKDEHKEQGNEERYLYKIEDNIIYRMDYDGKVNWYKFADIISYEKGDKKNKLVLKLADTGEETEFFENASKN